MGRKNLGLGNTVKMIREAAGLSRQKFAALYQIPVRTIENWEWGRSEPPKYLVRLLIRVVKEDFPEGFPLEFEQHDDEE